MPEGANVLDGDDLPEIKRGLADSAVDIFERLHGIPTKRTAREMRWGRKGSLVLYLRGRGGPHWHCYESCQGGDILAAIQHAMGLDFVGALDCARDWLGMPRRGEQRRDRHRVEPRPAQQSKPVDYDAEQAERSRRAAELAAAAAPIAGTLAEKYLSFHRGILADNWPGTLGFADAATVRQRTGWSRWRWPVLLVKATDAAGAVTGLQCIALQPDGAAAKHWDGSGRKLKQSFGALAGFAARLPGDDRALLLAEGPETALSCWHATGIETWANLGSITKAPLDSVPIDRLIVVCADDDARNAPSNKPLRDALKRWRGEGRRVVVVKPNATTRGDKSDFNDTLRAEGPEAVRERIEPDQEEPAARVLPHINDARQIADEMIGAAINEMLKPFAGEAEFRVLQMPTGIGKTEIAVRRAVKAAANGAKVIYLAPTHKLNNELAGRFAAEAKRQGANIPIEVFRGRGADRPGEPNVKMCSEYKTIRTSQAAKVKTADVCEICPVRDTCPYIAQFTKSAPIGIGAHDLLWRKMPAPLKGANLLIIDESITTSGLVGFTGQPRLITEADLTRRPQVEVVSLEADLHDKLMPSRHRIVEALRDHPEGGLRRERLLAAGLTPGAASVARGFEWAALYRMEIKGMSWKRAKEALEEAARYNFQISQFAALWHDVEELLAEDGTAELGRSLCGDHMLEGHLLRGSIRQFGAERIMEDWLQIPTLNIDATVSMELLKYRVPHADFAGEVEAAAPHMKVI